MASFGDLFGILKTAGKDFSEDDGTHMAAAIAYYTIFSLPPLLVLILTVASLFIGSPDRVAEQIQGQFSGMIGPEGAQQVETMMVNADRPGAGGPLTTILGVVALLFGAAGAFTALQGALNRAWEVAPDPDAGGIKNFITKRLFSFAMLLGIVFLLLVSLAVTALLHQFGEILGNFLPGGADTVVAQLLNIAISLAVITFLFAAIFKVMPDATISWKDVRVGAFATAVLFVIGKFLIGLYLGRSNPGSAFGAAGSLAVILVWIYYSSIILIFGAEFTQAWAQRFGAGIEPEPGAVRIVEETVDPDDPEASRA